MKGNASLPSVVKEYNGRQGMCRHCRVLRRQGVMRRQAMRRHNASSQGNASSGGNVSSGNVSSQCVVTG